MRSLAGDRDSEIAVAMWQPSHTLQRPFDANAPKLPRGDVHCFRMSVWGEHMDNGGSKEGTEAMMDPASLDCVHRVQELAAVRHLRASACSDATNHSTMKRNLQQIALHLWH